MAQPNTTFGRVLATTLYNYWVNGELADAIFNGTRFLSVLIKREIGRASCRERV